jgi:hypothetical protein
MWRASRASALVGFGALTGLKRVRGNLKASRFPL